MWLTLLHILDPPLYVATIPKGGGPWCLLGKSEIADSSPALAFQVSKNKMFPPCSIVKIEYYGHPTWPRDNVLGRRPTELNFKSCVWRAVSPHSYHHPQEVLLAQFSLYVNKCGVKPHSFYFITFYKANKHLTRRLPDNITVTLQQRSCELRKPSWVFILGSISC